MRFNMIRTSIFALLIAATLQPLSADEPRPSRLNIYPADVHLTTVRDRQSLIVQAEYADGITRDVTAQAKFALASEAAARLEKNVLYPKTDGNTELSISYAGLSMTIPVVVERSKDDPAISFQLDVMPVFMKTGCNTGSCHGAARGKDGFMLSLFGYDPNGDHHRLTREISGRRVNLASPEESLLIEKAAGLVPHTGGKKIAVGDERYDTLIRWLTAGAPNDRVENR